MVCDVHTGCRRGCRLSCAAWHHARAPGYHAGCVSRSGGPTSTAPLRSRMSIRPALAAVAAISLGACAAERTVEPGPGGPCSSSNSVATPALSAALASSRLPWAPAGQESAALALAPLTGAVVSFPGPRADLEDNSARYLVVPQYATQASAPASTTFQLTVGTSAVTASVASAAFATGT